jgi:hypothetical protein
MHGSRGTAEPKAARAKRLLIEQQRQIVRQRELVAQLENEGDAARDLRPARELLQQMIYAYDAMLREAKVLEKTANVPRRLDTKPSRSLAR